jgi:hypothetical protein
MKPLTDVEKLKAERLYRGGTGIQAIAYFIGRGLGPVKCHIDTLKRLGVVPEPQHPFEDRAEPYTDADERVVRRYPPGWAEGAGMRVTARPRATK